MYFKIQPNRVRQILVITASFFISLAVTAIYTNVDVSAQTLYNGLRQKVVTNEGSYAYIEAVDPSISSGWSYIRVASTSGSKYIEIGTQKDPNLNSGDPTPVWCWNDGTTDDCDDLPHTLYVGTQYNFQVEQHSSDTWKVFFNELNTHDETKDINTTTTSTVWVGGETNNSSNDVGDSDNHNSTYKNTSGSWTNTCSTGLVISPTTSPYTADDDEPSCNDFRVYDN